MRKNGGSIGGIDILIGIVCLVVVLLFLFTRVDFFVGIRRFFTDSVNFAHVGSVVNLILTILAIFFLTVIAYCSVRLLEIRKREHEHMHHEIEAYQHKMRMLEEQRQQTGSNTQNPRWHRVVEYTMSDNPGDWKLAILEADSMLADLMERLGFAGEGLGDRLKSATIETFRFLNQAWDAHSVRNRIAHEAGFEISSREAKRIIALYEEIFRGFEYI